METEHFNHVMGFTASHLQEHRPGVPGGRTAERSAERQRLAKAREGRGALAKEDGIP